VKPVCVDPFTREADALRLECWPAAELQRNVNRDELGNLGLTRREELQIIAFLGTLTDGWTAAPEPATGTLIVIAALALALSRRPRVSRATLADPCAPDGRPA
jgi:hypothetical protein